MKLKKTVKATAIKIGIAKARKTLIQQGELTYMDVSNWKGQSSVDELTQFEIEGWNSVYNETYGRSRNTESAEKNNVPKIKIDLDWTLGLSGKTKYWLSRNDIDCREKCHQWIADGFIFHKNFAIQPVTTTADKNAWQYTANKMPLSSLMELRIFLGVTKHFKSLNTDEDSSVVVKNAISILQRYNFKVCERKAIGVFENEA